MPPGVGLGSARLPQGHDDDNDNMAMQRGLARVGQKKKKKI